MSTKIITARTVAAFNAAVAAEILAGNSPVGVPQYTLYQPYPEIWQISISIAVGNTSVTSFKLLSAATPALLTTAVNTEITGGAALCGGHTALQSSKESSRTVYYQATYKGAAVDAGMGSASAAISTITGLQAALDAKVAATTTVNGHPLSGNVVVSGSDITTGTVPIAQLPVATNAAKGIASFGSGTTVNAGAVTVP